MNQNATNNNPKRERKIDLNEKSDVYVLEFHPSLPHILLSASYDGSVCLWDIKKNTLLKKFENKHGRSLDGCFSPLGFHFVTAHKDGTFTIYGIDNFDNYSQVRINIHFLFFFS